MRKRLNWKESTFLAVSALVLAVSGAKVFQREWDKVPVGRFQFIVASSKFVPLSQPSAVLLTRIRRQRRMLTLTSDNLAAMQATVYIGHEGSRPRWWGDKAVPQTWLSAVNSKGQGYPAIPGRASTSFDAARQQYVLKGDFAVPAIRSFTQNGHLLLHLTMNQPLDFVDISDTEAPIESRRFDGCFKIAMPDGLRSK